MLHYRYINFNGGNMTTIIQLTNDEVSKVLNKLVGAAIPTKYSVPLFRFIKLQNQERDIAVKVYGKYVEDKKTNPEEADKEWEAFANSTFAIKKLPAEMLESIPNLDLSVQEIAVLDPFIEPLDRVENSD